MGFVKERGRRAKKAVDGSAVTTCFVVYDRPDGHDRQIDRHVRAKTSTAQDGDLSGPKVRRGHFLGADGARGVCMRDMDHILTTILDVTNLEPVGGLSGGDCYGSILHK